MFLSTTGCNSILSIHSTAAMASRKYLVMKIATLIGLFLKTLTTGVSWYWGNISVYTDSYYRATFGPDSGFGTPWVMSTFMIGFAVGLLITQKVATRIGRTWTNILSLILFEIGIFASYFAINTSVTAIAATIGAVAGVGSGITEGQLLYYVLAWSDKHVGLISALVSSSYSGGSVLINQLVTLYVNPQNETPDLIDGNKVYFIQPAILNRVPSLFLLLGAVSFGAQFVGVLLIRDNPFKEKTKELRQNKDSGSNTPTDSSFTEETKPIIAATTKENGHLTHPQSYTDNSTTTMRRLISSATSEPFNSELPGERQTSNGFNSLAVDQCVGASAIIAKDDPCCGVSQSSTQSVSVDLTNPSKCLPENDNKDLSPLQLLKVPSFYAMWLSTVATDYSYIIITNFYKTFGQTVIKDDHFLTSVAMVTSVVSTFSEIFWGASLDRFKLKYCLILYLASQAVVGSFWYFTAIAGKYVYMLSTLILGCMNAGMYEVFFVGTLKLFGETHFSLNYGVVYSGSVLVNMAAPPIIDFIVQSFDWFYLFFSFSIFNTLALVVVVITLPYK
ncbi:hypothetical protein BgiBS90_032709 [Biomphalaria glabrata]|nr:hypothetical protein BgiBS90_032709 [Biomphalaria glabrata]